MPVFSDEDWNDLLDDIEGDRVIPVLGERAATFGDADKPLYPELACALADKLGVSLGPSSAPSLASVARAYLTTAGSSQNQIYSRLHRIVTTPPRKPGSVLRQLAEIDGFTLYLSATCDSLLEDALRQARPSVRPRVVAYHPNASKKDLPPPEEGPPVATIYHLLGKASPSRGEFVVWEDDLLDFLLGLAHDFQTEATRRFRAALDSRSLLAIGLDLSDWILLLLLRIARQHPFVEDRSHRAWINEPIASPGYRSTVFMIGGVRGGVRPIDSTMESFVDQLSIKWKERVAARNGHATTANTIPKAKVRGGGRFAFISYAREDEPAARNIKDALQARCCVFFDREGLKTGVNYERELEAKVKEAAVFISIVSQNTEKKGDAFFKAERNWAAERARFLSDSERGKFYVPVLVDETLPDSLTYEPDIFRKSQWTHCPKGKTDTAPQFVDIVADLCEDPDDPEPR